MMAVVRQLFMLSRQFVCPVLLKDISALKCPTTQRFFSVTTHSFLKESKLNSLNIVVSFIIAH